MRIAKLLVCTLLLVTGCLSGCAVNQSDIRGFNLISIDEEKQLGDKFAIEVEKQHKVLADAEVNRYVDKLGRRLLTGAKEVSFPYAFKVVQDPSVNAFAIPGGRVYVNTGLIKAAQSEEELAGVMAHEINHAVARHGTRQLTQQYGYALVLQLILGDNPNMLAQLAASMFGQAGFMAYSRGMESQADFLGVETMARAGYNPEGMLTFFAKLDAMNTQKPTQLTQFFSSHPLTSERVQRVSSEISTLPAQRYSGPTDRSEFARIKARLP
jgi:predicted Zn-dependent protease